MGRSIYRALALGAGALDALQWLLSVWSAPPHDFFSPPPVAAAGSVDGAAGAGAPPPHAASKPAIAEVARTFPRPKVMNALLVRFAAEDTA
jgi:hypothetical protein